MSILSNPSLPLGDRKAVDLLAGIIFFGTPHKKKNHPESGARVTWLLKHAGSMPKLFLAISELDSVALINICEDFEQSDVQAPVLSVYETKPTKLKERFWLSRSEVVSARYPIRLTIRPTQITFTYSLWTRPWQGPGLWRKSFFRVMQTMMPLAPSSRNLQSTRRSDFF